MSPWNEPPNLIAVILLLAFLALMLSLPTIEAWWKRRRDSRAARKRNQARPWR